MRYSTGTLLRYPLIFGGILTAFGYAFFNRDKFMTDLDEERKRLDRQEEGSQQIIQETIESMQKARAAKKGA